MNILTDFSAKNFAKQIMILDKIEKQKKHEAIPDLFKLYERYLNNDVLGYMIKSTLRELLSENEEETVSRLLSDNPIIKKLCIEIAGQQEFKSAYPKLANLAANETDNQMLFDILSALSKSKSVNYLKIFQKHIKHSDSLIAALSIEMIGRCGDDDSIKALYEIIDIAEEDEHYEECSLETANAIIALKSFKNDAAISFLVSKIHHRNPAARMLIHEQLIEFGSKAVHFIIPVFDNGNIDEKIMSVNVLERIGGKETSDALVRAIDKGIVKDSNIRFAVYEALGKVRSLKSLVWLVDGLMEQEEFILTAVMSSLNQIVNPGIIKRIQDIINYDNIQGKRLLQAVISSKSLAIFEYLYKNGAKIANQLIELILKSNDQDTVSAFYKKLEQIGSPGAISDAKRLKEPSVYESGKKLLAVDDSKAMLSFYRRFISEIGIKVTTVLNGRQALGLLENGEDFDLILTDLNMPVMDGIRLTRKIRDMSEMVNIPIIMVTTESERSQAQLAKKAGVDDFIMKPCPAKIMQDKIKEFI
ncbi:Response regulator [Candidatus Magnetomoraceae bacterium gMMP-15]